MKDFKTTAFGAKLYRFAHEMQIETLTEELTEFFKQTKTSEIFSLFDLYCMSDNKVGLDNCKMVREDDFISRELYFNAIVFVFLKS